MIRAGLPGPVELEASRSWDPRTGWSITRRFRGQKEYLVAYESAHKSAGAKTSWDPTDDSSIVILNATYGAEESQPPDEALTDRWELVGNDMEKSLFELPSVQAEFAKIPVDDSREMRLAATKKNVQRLADGEALVVNTDGSETEGSTALSTFLGWVEEWGMDKTVIQKLIRTMAKGVEAWTVSQWVLRHTQVIANNSTLKPSMVNVGRIYTTAMVQAVEAIPSTIKFDLPTGYWLKRTPTIEQTSWDKWTITQEYWHSDGYDDFVYDMAT